MSMKKQEPTKYKHNEKEAAKPAHKPASPSHQDKAASNKPASHPTHKNVKK